MFNCIRRFFSLLVAKDNYYATKHPFIYPFSRMALIFIALQVFVQIMYFYSESGSAVLETNPAHPPNNHTPIFPTDHAPLQVIEDGSLRTLHRIVGGADVAMVMLYAPWCFHSIRLAKTFVELAKNQEEVTFIAINCWSPSGECRRGEGVAMFPRIAVYRPHLLDSLEYFGDKNYQSLLSYSHTVVRPLVYITSTDQFNELLREHELLVIGYFNFTKSSSATPHSYQATHPGYKQYYLASILALQTGTLQTPLLCVVTNDKVGGALGLPHPLPRLLLIAAHRGVIESLPITNMSPQDIYNWATVNITRHRLVHELVPAGDMTRLLATPILLLFLPLGQIGSSEALAQFITAAHYNDQSNSLCSDLAHLSHTSCPSPDHSLPLCQSDPLSLCPKYNPLYSDHTHFRSCQDKEALSMKGAWPPPCTTVRTTFYYVDSNKYWSLAESVGVAVTVATKGGQYAIFIDLKNKLQYYLNVSSSTIHFDYSNMLEDIVAGSATPFHRSGCGPNSSAKCSRGEVTTDEFFSIMRPHPLPHPLRAVLVVHYVSWCVTCVHIWPLLHSINNRYDHTRLNIIRINGDYNDLPGCHAPQFYPSIALYTSPGSRPLWYPDNHPLTVENIVKFIRGHVALVALSNRTDQSDELVAEWDGMGWQLWQQSERERVTMERNNLKLAREVSQLREQLASLEQQKEAESGSHGNGIAELIDQLTKLVDTRRDHTHLDKDHTHSDNAETCEDCNSDQ